VYVPPATLDVPPEVLELWAQVVLRGELGPDGGFVGWDEPAWEGKRQELAARARPTSDFPFPGRITDDRLHWVRVQADELMVRPAVSVPSSIDPDRALPLLDRLLAAEPTAEWYLDRGGVREQLGRWEAAADDYLAARRIRPDRWYPDLDRVARDRVQGAGQPAEQYRAAVRLAEAARREKPDSPDVARTLGIAYYRAGRHRDAVAPLEEVARAYRQNLLRRFVGAQVLSPWAAAQADAAQARRLPGPLAYELWPSGPAASADRERALTLAFLAVAYHRLGMADEARARLAERRSVLANPPLPMKEGDAETQLREAIEEVEGGPGGK
jgi:tetratricopeptide (TPR) repeat protein